MYCIECGKQIPDQSKFCCFCGSTVVNCMEPNCHTPKESCMPDVVTTDKKERQGTQIYLNDILSIEFAINKLEHELNVAKSPIILHDYWFYSECFQLQYPLQAYEENLTRLNLTYSHYYQKYYYLFLNPYERITYYDHSGHTQTDQHGKPCRAIELDPITRQKMCTLPKYKKKLFRGYILENASEIYPWHYRQSVECVSQIRNCIEQFEAMVSQREHEYQTNLPLYNKKIDELEQELAKAKDIRDDLYGMDIVPNKFRNLGCAYFIYDFFSSSNTSLDKVFLHLDLDTIQTQLSTIIENQRDAFIQRSIMISQNDEIIAQNRQLFDELSNMNQNMNRNLSSIRESSIETAHWARIGALNAEATAWLSAANYLK